MSLSSTWELSRLVIFFSTYSTSKTIGPKSIFLCLIDCGNASTALRGNGRTRRNLSAFAPRPRGSGTMFAISFPAPFSAPRFLCSGFVSLLFLSSPKFMELSTLYTTPRGVVNLHFRKMPAPAGCSAGCSYSSRK